MKFEIMEKIAFLLTAIILFVACNKKNITNSENVCETKTEILPPKGYSINTISEIDYNGSIRSFQFVNQQVGYLLASSNRGGYVDVYKTTDGGKNWVDLDLDITLKPRSMVFKDENYGIIAVHDTEGCPPPNCKHKCVILITEDGGITWQEKEVEDLKGTFYHPQYDTEGNLYANLSFLNSNVSPVESQTTLMKSTDDGLTWETFFSSADLDISLLTYSLKILNNKIFVSAKDNKILVIDKDGTLIKTIEINNLPIWDVELIDEDNFVVVTSTGVLKSINGGETWETIHNGSARMIGFDSVDKGLMLLTKSICADYDVFYPDDIIAATNNGGIEWIEPEEGATSLKNIFSYSQKIGDSWYIIFGKQLLEIEDN